MASTRIGDWLTRTGHVAGRAHRGFRRWRRGRPFWGGLFTILGGAEILLLPALKLPVLIQVGIAGISGLIAGILMVVVGLSVWFAPHFRVFAGVATILFSLASFLTSNFGGFLLGMLLGLLGGSLSCAWVPVRPRPTEPPATSPAAPVAPAPADGDPGAPSSDSDAQDGTAGEEPTGGHVRRLPLAALLLVASLLATILAGPGPAAVRLAATQLPTINSLVPTMHADTVDMSALSFDGVVDVPTAQGPLPTLKFSMGSVVMHGYSLDAPAGLHGGAVALVIDTLTLRSNVDFYTTRMSGLLFGTLPVTYTPDTPPLLVPASVTFTGFSSEQVFVRSDTLTANGLDVAAGTT